MIWSELYETFANELIGSCINMFHHVYSFIMERKAA